MYRARYRRIVFFFARVLISITFWDIFLAKIGLRGQAQKTRPRRLRQYAASFRSLAVQMGGVLIKVGQFLSTRVDVLPIEITSELTDLQDEVPPVDYQDIRKVAEADFDMPLAQKYLWFEATPLAAASLGQAHRAQVQLPAPPTSEEGQVSRPGRVIDVVVKIQRPNIEAIISVDLSALRTVGGWLQRYRPISRRADVPALLQEFTRILLEEVDYLAEGRNAETFAVNFRGQAGVRVPHVIWSHTTRRVLTLENVWAIKITDYDAITAAGIDRGEVATRLLNTYLQQIFSDGFFHADPHPGNLFVTPPHAVGRSAGGFPIQGSRSDNWQLTFVDFGMVGHVPANLREGLRELLIGVGTQDAARVVRSYQTLGVLLPNADLELIEKAESRLFERFWGKSMSELRNTTPEEIKEWVNEFRELIYAMPFQVPHDLIFLFRTVSILSGICTGLDQDFNVWDHLAPFAQQLIMEEAKHERESWLEEAGNLARAFLSIPRKMDSMLSKIERGEIAVRSPEISRQVGRLENALRLVVGSIIFAALLLSGTQLYLAGKDIFAIITIAGSGITLIWVLLETHT